jgi:hypothetical protein
MCLYSEFDLYFIASHWKHNTGQTTHGNISASAGIRNSDLTEGFLTDHIRASATIGIL